MNSKIKDILAKTQSDLEKLSESKGEVTGLATGWYDFDRITTGLHPNEFIIIAARPAVGKTAFALNLATHVAMNEEKSVAIIDFDLGATTFVSIPVPHAHSNTSSSFVISLATISFNFL